MAGLDPAIYSSHESVVKVVSLGILDEDKIDFPGARPMLHIPLTLDRRANVVVALSPNQTFKAVLLGETIRYTFSMGNTGLRYSNLMREICFRNGGTFIALQDL